LRLNSMIFTKQYPSDEHLLPPNLLDHYRQMAWDN
jgi:hypothetical protein